MNSLIRPINAEMAALITGSFNFLGDQFNNANFMFNNYLNVFQNDWGSIPKDWRAWEPMTFNEILKKIFLLKIRESLKMAIINIASTFDYIIDLI